MTNGRSVTSLATARCLSNQLGIASILGIAAGSTKDARWFEEVHKGYAPAQVNPQRIRTAAPSNNAVALHWLRLPPSRAMVALTTTLASYLEGKGVSRTIPRPSSTSRRALPPETLRAKQSGIPLRPRPWGETRSAKSR